MCNCLVTHIKKCFVNFHGENWYSSISAAVSNLSKWILSEVESARKNMTAMFMTTHGKSAPHVSNNIHFSYCRVSRVKITFTGSSPWFNTLNSNYNAKKLKHKRIFQKLTFFLTPFDNGYFYVNRISFKTYYSLY